MTSRVNFLRFQTSDRHRFKWIFLLVTLPFLFQFSCTFADDLYDYSTSSVTKLDPSNFDSLVVGSTETWLVEFYAPWCGHCRNLAPAWNKAAKRLKGVARVGAVNCDEHQYLAQQYGVQGFPTIKIFKGMGQTARQPEDYQGARSAGAIVSYAKSVIPSFVSTVKQSGIDAFFKDEKELPHVLLFTDKKKTSPLYKGLSATFFGRLALGEVRKEGASDLLKKYAITKFPTIISFKANSSLSDEATVYDGAMDPESLAQYLGTLAGDAPKKKEDEPVFKQPDAFKDDIRLLESSKQYNEYCGNRPDNRMCGLTFLPKGDQHPVFNSLKDIAEQFKFDNIAILAIESDSEYGKMLAKAFEIDASKGAFLAVRSGKPKYTVMSKEKEVTTDNIRGFLDSVVSGNVRYQRLTSELPRWDPPTKVDSKKAETSQKTSTEGNTTSDDEGDEVCDAHTQAKCGAAKEEL